MKRPLIALLCIAAALAGWGGMAWWRGVYAAPAGKTAFHAPGAGATGPGEFARPAGKLPPGANPGLSTLTEALAQARALDPADPEARAKLTALPPGAARDLALALFDARAARPRAGDGETKPFNPFADLPADAELSRYGVAMEGTARRLLAGEPLEEFADDALRAERAPFASSGGDMLTSLDAIKNWAGLDPAAASETILKMPPGKSRTAAVDAAAEVMALSDPQAAWDLVLKSGEQKLGEGAARAWLACTASPAGTGDQSLAKLPATLQEAILKQTAGLLQKDGPMDESRRVLSRSEMDGLVVGLRGVAFGPGKEALLKAMMGQETFSAELIQPLMTVTQQDGRPRSPEMEVMLSRQVAQIASEDPEAALDIARDLLASTNSGEYQLQQAAIAAAAPEFFGPLARAGHVKEVAPLVERIADPQQRRTALESILPQWMDADPAAARAAFNAAPFTALERERWRQHPSFLLNPATP